MVTPPAHSLSLSWDELHQDTRSLAQRLAGRSFTGIAGIARGGLVPAAIIARELGIRQVDTICIASYDDQIQGEAKLLKGIAGDGEGLLVVDDLVDTGVTARMVRALLPKAYIATVYAKPAGSGDTDTYVTLVSQDTWIVFPWDQFSPVRPDG